MSRQYAKSVLMNSVRLQLSRDLHSLNHFVLLNLYIILASFHELPWLSYPVRVVPSKFINFYYSSMYPRPKSKILQELPSIIASFHSLSLDLMPMPSDQYSQPHWSKAPHYTPPSPRSPSILAHHYTHPQKPHQANTA